MIENYSDRYYIKNEKFGAEYYQPAKSYRYVTVTGNSIYNNHLEQDASFKNILLKFLNDYMLKPERKSYEIKTEEVETKTFEELMKDVKLKYFRDIRFQDLWFSKAPGSGKDESERDYHLVAYIYDYITKDKDKIKQIFEQSPFFKSKDWKHVNKWTKQDFRYFNYLYDRINSKGE